MLVSPIKALRRGGTVAAIKIGSSRDCVWIFPKCCIYVSLRSSAGKNQCWYFQGKPPEALDNISIKGIVFRLAPGVYGLYEGLSNDICQG